MTILRPYGSNSQLKTVGEFESLIKSQTGTETKALFVVAPGKFGNLSSYRTSLDLGIINNINNVSENEASEFKSLMINNYPNLFAKKIGKISDVKLQLHIDPTVKPVYQRLRPQPYHLLEPIRKCLDKMEENDLIAIANMALLRGYPTFTRCPSRTVLMESE